MSMIALIDYGIMGIRLRIRQNPKKINKLNGYNKYDAQPLNHPLLKCLLTLSQFLINTENYHYTYYTYHTFSNFNNLAILQTIIRSEWVFNCLITT